MHEIHPCEADTSLKASENASVDRQAYQEMAVIVHRIRSNDPQGLEELYRLLQEGARYQFANRLPFHEIDDRIHETFLAIVQAIRRGDLREPERLMGFLQTVVRRQVAASIAKMVRLRSSGDIKVTESIVDGARNQEQMAISHERAQIGRKLLSGLDYRSQEILRRFYLQEETSERICSEMRLTPTQFRLYKSRAKAKLGDLGKKLAIKKMRIFAA